MTAALRELAEWLVTLDEPDSQPRRTVSLSVIVERAKAALQQSPPTPGLTTPPIPASTAEDAIPLESEDPGADLVRLSSGQLLRAHPVWMCEGRACCVHAPSDHHMRSWVQSWRGDRGLMERICRHGVGHPDPDDIAFKLEHLGVESAYIEAIHGCDGCCRNVPYFGTLTEEVGSEDGDVASAHTE